LEETLKTIEFQPPYHGQGHFLLDQVAQSLIQPGLKHFQVGTSSYAMGAVCVEGSLKQFALKWFFRDDYVDGMWQRMGSGC